MYSTRKGRQIPHIARSKLPLWDPPHLAQREKRLTFSTDQFLSVPQEIMTETGILGRVSNEACGRYSEGHLEVNLRVNLRSIWS